MTMDELLHLAALPLRVPPQVEQVTALYPRIEAAHAIEKMKELELL